MGIFVKKCLPTAISRFSKIKKRLRETGLVLDVGCSVGLLTGELAPRCGKIVGVDIDRSSVLAAQKLFGSKCTFVMGNSMALPFKEGIFDAVVSSEVIEHVNKPEIFASEMSRVLRKAGQAIVTTPNGDMASFFVGRFPMPSLMWLLAKTTRDSRFVHPFGHFYGSFSPQTLNETLSSVKIEPEKTDFCGFYLTRILEDFLYALTVVFGKTKEVSWVDSEGFMFSLADVLIKAITPLVRILVWIDELPIRFGIEGRIMVFSGRKN